MQSDMNFLHSEVNELNEKIQTLKAERLTMNTEMDTLKDLLATKKAEQDRESRAREKAEVSLRQANDVSKTKETELVAKTKEIHVLKEHIGKLETAVKDEKSKVEKESKEKDLANSRLGRLQSEFDEQVLTTTRLQSEAQQHSADIKTWEEELDKYKEEYRGITRMKEMLQKKIKTLEEGKLEAEVERDNLRVSIKQIYSKADNRINRKQMFMQL
jgi:chromosome segregation ATPase